MSEDDPGGSLDDLGKRISTAQQRRVEGEAPPNASERSTSAGYAMAARIGVEMVAAIAVGVLIGWSLDGWLGTRPWLMVAFLFLGAAAGILNVYRAMAGYGLAIGYGRPGNEGHDDADHTKG